MSEEQKVLELIKRSDRILLHLHPKPDPDSIGSALATYHALKGLDKEVVVIQGDSPLPEDFSVLPGYSDIVHKGYFDIVLSDFDLFIIQDSGSIDMISRKDKVVFPLNLKTIVIDHHKTNTRYADVNLVDASYAATCEYLFDLFNQWEFEVTKDIAACLFAGIFGDTGGFKYTNTTARTLKTASKLAEIYPDFSQMIDKLENSNTKEKIMFDALALSSIETFFNDSVAIATIPFEELEKRKIKPEDLTSNIISNTLISVKQWKVGITLIEKFKGETSVSLRSKNGIDVSLVAVKLGGGGHVVAAGAYVKMPPEEVKKKVLELVKELV